MHVLGPGAALRHRLGHWGDHAQPKLDTAPDTPESALQLGGSCADGGIQLLFAGERPVEPGRQHRAAPVEQLLNHLGVL